MLVYVFNIDLFEFSAAIRPPFSQLILHNYKTSFLQESFEKATPATMAHEECVGSHPRSRGHNSRIRMAKEILKSKYGGTRRLLRAYMDQLEQMPLIRSNDIHALEKFVDLVRITVVKLQAEGKDGELGDGTLHSLMVKKLPDRQLENYSRWLNEREREKSVSFQRLA